MAKDKLSFGERIVKALGGVTERTLVEERTRMHQAGVRDGMEIAEAAPIGGDDESPLTDASGVAIAMGYKRIGDTPRDLSSVSQERAIEAMYRLWNTNPLAKALTEVVLDYVLGAGVEIVAEDDTVQVVLDEFIEDPVNRLDGEGLEGMVRELALFGEQLILTFVRTGVELGGIADGLLRLGNVDPSRIAHIITDKDNVQQILAVRLKSKSGGLEDGPLYKIVQADGRGQPFMGKENLALLREKIKEIGDEDRVVEGENVAKLREAVTAKLTPDQYRVWAVHEIDGSKKREFEVKELEVKGIDENTKFEGECFLFQVNKLTTGVRGRPDLLPSIDWLDRMDQTFFDGIEHMALLNYIVWHLQIEGGSETAPEPELNLKMQAKKFQKMKPNSVYATNAKVKLIPQTPDLKSEDMARVLRQLRVFIAGGNRIPEHWIAEGGYTNRATAKEMGQPTFRMLTRRQEFVRYILETLCQYQIDIKVALGLLKPEVPVLDEDGKVVEDGETIAARDAFTVTMPDINVSDTSTVASAFQAVVQAVITARSSGLLPDKPAVELIAAMADLIGVEIDVQATLDEVEDFVPLPNIFPTQPKGKEEEPEEEE
jgi:hypothetical protein